MLYLIPIIILLILTPYFIKKIKEVLEIEELERNFPIFLRDLAQYLEIGQPLPVAIRSVMQNNYGKLLNKEIRKMVSEMEFGQTFMECLERMAKRVKSDKVKKTIYSILEAEKVGGDIKGVLQYISASLQDLMNIKQERIARLKNFMLIYYGIFIGLLIVVIVMAYLVKMFAASMYTPSLMTAFKYTAFVLLILNAIFTGLVAGKVSTGRIVSGFIHSIILTAITVMAFIFFLV